MSLWFCDSCQQGDLASSPVTGYQEVTVLNSLWQGCCAAPLGLANPEQKSLALHNYSLKKNTGEKPSSSIKLFLYKKRSTFLNPLARAVPQLCHLLFALHALRKEYVDMKQHNDLDQKWLSEMQALVHGRAALQRTVLNGVSTCLTGAERQAATSLLGRMMRGALVKSGENKVYLHVFMFPVYLHGLCLLKLCSVTSHLCLLQMWSGLPALQPYDPHLGSTGNLRAACAPQRRCYILQAGWQLHRPSSRRNVPSMVEGAQLLLEVIARLFLGKGQEQGASHFSH